MFTSTDFTTCERIFGTSCIIATKNICKRKLKKSNRVGHHSTSDDSSAYRPIEEVDQWTKHDHPTDKFKIYLQNKGYWDEDKDKRWAEDAKKNVLTAFAAAEKKSKPAWTEVFNDVYYKMPKHIELVIFFSKEYLDIVIYLLFVGCRRLEWKNM